MAGHNKNFVGQETTETSQRKTRNSKVMQMQSKYNNEERGAVNITHKAYKDKQYRKH